MLGKVLSAQGLGCVFLGFRISVSEFWFILAKALRLMSLGV